MVNHSCVPNAFVQFVDRRALLKAYQAIKEGEEVEISYIGKPALHCLFFFSFFFRIIRRRFYY